MLGNFGSRLLDGDAARAARNAEPASRPATERPAPEPPPRAEPTVRPEMMSSIGCGMSITGNIVCDGPMQVHGRIDGELRATEVLIGDSAQVEGNIVAQELTIRGRVKGTIRAVRVKLQGNGTVEGDIFHRSLSIEENALFEGSSHRVENPVEATAPVTRSAPGPFKTTFKPSLQALGDLSPDTAA